MVTDPMTPPPASSMERYLLSETEPFVCVNGSLASPRTYCPCEARSRLYARASFNSFSARGYGQPATVFSRRSDVADCSPADRDCSMTGTDTTTSPDTTSATDTTDSSLPLNDARRRASQAFRTSSRPRTAPQPRTMVFDDAGMRTSLRTDRLGSLTVEGRITRNDDEGRLPPDAPLSAVRSRDSFAADGSHDITPPPRPFAPSFSDTPRFLFMFNGFKTG